MKIKVRPTIIIIATFLGVALVVAVVKGAEGELINPLIVAIVGVSTKLIESEEAGEKDQSGK